MHSHLRPITRLGFILLSSLSVGCAPVPRSDPKEGAKPFLDELKFVDQKSLDVIHCDEPDERGLVRIIFSTDSVDFNHEHRLAITKEIPSRIIVEIIEERSSYKFRRASTEYTSMLMKVGPFGEATFDIVQDGEKYILICLYIVPKAKLGSAPTTETKK